MKTLIKNARLIFPYSVSKSLGWLEIDGGYISAFGIGEKSGGCDAIIDAEGMYLSPGFVDIHVHGGGGADFRDAEEKSTLTALHTHLAGGTTTIFPTLSSTSQSELFECIASYDCIKENELSYSGIPNLAGLHLEGPYFSLVQCGAQNPDLIRKPDPREYMKVLEATANIKRWSVACELDGAMELGRVLSSKGICASIGHSDATTAQVFEAFQNGFSSVTHLYSGCSMLHRNGPYREGGVVEGAFLIDDMDVEVIADGIHLPPDFLKLIFKIKGMEHVALITDCIRPGGLRGKDAEEVYDDKARTKRIFVENGVAVMPDRKSFAGSIASTSRLVRTVCEKADAALHDAVRMASLNPARIQHIENVTGSISVGKRADLLLLDEKLNVKRAIVRGKTEYIA